MSKSKNRFINTKTKQIHRFIPLFENRFDDTLMGVCIDSDKSNDVGNHPYIRKGQMILVGNGNRNRIGYTYKGESLFELLKVYGGEYEFENITMENHLSDLSGGYGYRWKRVGK